MKIGSQALTALVLAALSLAAQSTRPVGTMGPELVVVHGHTWAPVPQAEVELVLSDDVFREIDLWAGEEAIKAAGERHRRTLQADESGRLRLPQIGSGCSLVGRAPQLWGRASYQEIPSKNSEVLVLPLYPEGRLQVQTVDAEGRPVSGIPLAFIAETGYFTETIWRGATKGPHAIESVEHVDWLTAMSAIAIHRNNGSGQGMSLGIDLFGAHHEAFPISPHDVPEGILRLTVPPMGSLAIDVPGIPTHQLARARLHATSFLPKAKPQSGAKTPAESDSGREDWHMSRSFYFRRQQRELSRVRPGCRFNLVLHSIEGSFAPIRAYGVEGPTKVGETAKVTLKPIEATVRIEGRFTNDIPWATRPVMANFDLSCRGKSLGYAPGLTDASGRFSIRVDVSQVPADTPIDVGIRVSKGSRKLVASARVTRKERENSVKLGDIELEERPLIAAGRVVNPHGIPVHGARVWAGPTHTMTDLAGCFRVYGEFPGECPVEVTKPGWPDLTPPVLKKPRSDLRYVMSPGGAVRGRLILPGGGPLDDLELVLSVPGSEGRPRTMSLDRTCEFFLDAVAARFVDLELRVPFHAPIPLGRLETHAGDPAAAPWHELDLRTVLSVQKIRVLDEQGDPVKGARICLPTTRWYPHFGRWAHPSSEISDEKGILRAWSGPEAPEVFVWAENRRPVGIRLDGASRDSVLSSHPFEVTIQFAKDLPLPARRRKLNVFLKFVPEGRDGSKPLRAPWRDLENQHLGAERRASFQAWEPGEYIVGLTIVVLNQRVVKVEPRPRIKISPDLLEQEMRVTVDREALRKAYERAAKVEESILGGK